MTKIELIEMLVRQAIEFRNDKNWFIRNSHMHNVESVDQGIVDNVLTGFINYVAGCQCIDYGMYVSDFANDAKDKI